MFKILFVFILAQVTFISCTAQTIPVSPGGKELTAVLPYIKGTQEKPKEEWQIKWEKVSQGAKKENKVVVYGAATGQIREALIKAFSERHGISVEYLAAKGPEIAAKVMAEMRAGLHLPDVIIGASVPSVSMLKPAGAFDPMEPVLILPEVIDPKAWWEGKVPWVDREHYFIGFLAYVHVPIVTNPDFVRQEDIKSYRDILEPKWKGKLAMHDPTIAGAGRSFIAVQSEQLMGVDYLRQLAGQEPFISRDHRLLAEWVARGKYPVGIAVESEAIEQLRSAGVTLQSFIPVEGTYVSMGTGFLSLPKNAPHPNASALFINWLLSKEGQLTYTNVARLQSARIDIPTTNVDPISMRKPGVKYFNTNNEEYQLRGPDYINLGKEIFGHLIK